MFGRSEAYQETEARGWEKRCRGKDNGGAGTEARAKTNVRMRVKTETIVEARM